MIDCDGVGRGLRACAAERDCLGLDFDRAPYSGAGKITRGWSRSDSPSDDRNTALPHSQSKDQSSQSAKRSSVAAGDRSRLTAATFKTLAPEERERWTREEREFIKQHDHDEANIWFLVDVRWLAAWRAFYQDSTADFPGPIDNGRLVDGVSGEPKPGFQVKEHYRGVNSALWHFWHKRYGGGPAIQRDRLDLYAVPPDALDKTMTVPRPGGPRSTTAGLEDTLVVQRPARPGGGLEDTVVFQRPVRPAPLREEAEAPKRAPPREEPSPASSRRRAASVQPGRSREEPRAEERRSGTGAGGPSSVRSNTSARSAAPAPAPAPARAGGGAANRGKSVPATGGRQNRSSKAAVKCDKCDGPHETDSCPHFSKPRERHKDAWSMIGKAGKAGQAEEDVPVVKTGRVVPQPGDGSCLFHALSYGLSSRSQGQSLRREICDFIARNPELEIGDVALSDWIKYDSGGNVQSYARQMQGSNWGGGIEMAAFTKLKGVNVHVYEKVSGGFRRISAFQSPGAKKTVSVLYCGRAHYDALVF